MPLERVWTTVGDTIFHARACLDAGLLAPPVVFVHGLGVSSRYMEPALHAVGWFARAYAPDLPGFGRTPPRRRALNIDELAHALARWMDAAGVPQATLVGNSMGTQVITRLAALEPARAHALVLTGPTMDRHARNAREQIQRLMRDAVSESPFLWAIVAADYLTTSWVRAGRTLAYALAHRPEDDAPRVTAPTLIVRGERDHIAPAAWCRELAARFPNGRLITIPGAAHALNHSHPHALAALIEPLAHAHGAAA